jgi:hypothetical protein
MDIEGKIKRLGLLLVSEQTTELEAYYSKAEMTNITARCQQFEFVVWRHDQPVFYSKKFLQETEVEEIEKFLSLI